MARLLKDIKFPEGTMFLEPEREYHYGAFIADERMFVSYPGFDWLEYIDYTFRKCLSNTMNRFMKVV